MRSDLTVATAAVILAFNAGWVAVNWGPLLLGLGACMAGLGSLLSGWAALHSARKEGIRDAEAAASSP